MDKKGKEPNPVFQSSLRLLSVWGFELSRLFPVRFRVGGSFHYSWAPITQHVVRPGLGDDYRLLMHRVFLNFVLSQEVTHQKTKFDFLAQLLLSVTLITAIVLLLHWLLPTSYSTPSVIEIDLNSTFGCELCNFGRADACLTVFFQAESIFRWAPLKKTSGACCFAMEPKCTKLLEEE